MSLSLHVAHLLLEDPHFRKFSQYTRMLMFVRVHRVYLGALKAITMEHGLLS